MKTLVTFCLLFATLAVSAQNEWPKLIAANDGSIIKIYQPQPESFSNNILKYRSAISFQNDSNTDPLFGTFWTVATVETDKDNRKITIVSAKIPNLKIAGDSDETQINDIKSLLQSQIPSVAGELPLDEVLASLDMRVEEKKLSTHLNNTPPKIIYTTRPSILVLINGNPILQHNKDWGVDVVINTPFTMVKVANNFYLYGGKRWYVAAAATGPYQYAENNIPAAVKKVETALNNNNNAEPGYESDSAAAQHNVVSDIIVSTTNAELVQSNGEANFTPISGTNLLYVSNSDNDIFMDASAQQYYLLISGRWYKSPQLKNGNWQYITSSNLPADFSRIPEGSAKDNVLANVAGTPAAREAIMDAQIPQTAKVDRKKAKATVTYDGTPQFENIKGTNMQYGVNTQSSVVAYKGSYYCVENGVWFEAPTATGPWSVATQRPDEVDIIPPSYPVYNMKYVYIYDVSPDWVYMGYTPGYLNAFIDGPTVVYGTGYNYNPWWGNYYYPRPYTWGFGMHYNPWMGWSLGFDYSFNWFNIGFGASYWNGWGGGWWGPSIYHPPFGWRPWGGGYGYGFGGYYRNGFYGNRFSNNRFINERSFNTNIYNYRNDVVINRTVINHNNAITNINSNNRFISNNISTRSNTNRPIFDESRNNNNRANPRSNTITTDREGNVFQRDQRGQWLQQRQPRQWQPVNAMQRPQVIQNLERQQQMQNRGMSRFQNFQSQRAMAPLFNRPAGNSNGGGNRFGGFNGGGNNNNRKKEHF